MARVDQRTALGFSPRLSAEIQDGTQVVRAAEQAPLPTAPALPEGLLTGSHLAFLFLLLFFRFWSGVLFGWLAGWRVGRLAGWLVWLGKFFRYWRLNPMPCTY